MSTQQEKKLSIEKLDPKVRAEIDAWLTRFPEDQKQSGVLYALRLAQEQNNGWLSEELMDAVADYLDLPHIAVYEVATFYSMYDLKPVGKHKISVCVNISCKLCGSDAILDHLKKRLNIGPGETTEDGRYTVKAVECLAACSRAPALQVDDKHYYDNLTPEKIDQMLDELEKGDK